jgi:hypothetical protein
MKSEKPKLHIANIDGKIQAKLKEAIVIRKHPYEKHTIEYYDKEKIDKVILELVEELDGTKKQLKDVKKEFRDYLINDYWYDKSFILQGDY